jgi:CrcB protein
LLNWIAVGFGGALWAMARYGLSTVLLDTATSKLPYATLTANVLGSLVMGILYVVIVEKAMLPPEMRSVLMVGFLGAFTTFSTFSLDALGLWQNGHVVLALVYALGTVCLCLAAITVAVWLTRLY